MHKMNAIGFYCYLETKSIITINNGHTLTIKKMQIYAYVVKSHRHAKSKENCIKK